MTPDKSDTTRRRLMKGIGATGLALSTAGVAAATEGDSAESDDAEPEDGWEYRCTSTGCPDGHGCIQQKRYCSNNQCSGWETDGCCGCAP